MVTPNTWVEFPWEHGGLALDREDTVRRMLEQIGEDVNRPGLIETPRRVAESWDELFGGIKVDPASLLKMFEVGDRPRHTAPVYVRDIPFVSTCEHHLMPFTGKVTVAYSASGKVIGLSKIPRVVHALSRRLQVQERLTQEIADVIGTVSHGAAVRVVATHACVTHRGVESHGVHMDTTAYSGIYATDVPGDEMRKAFIQSS